MMRRFFFGSAWVMLVLLVLWGLNGGIWAQDKGFAGEEVQTAEQAVAPGGVELVISLEVPAGYEIMRDAPLLAKVTSADKQVIALGKDSSATCKQPHFPLRVPLKAQSGATQLQVDLVLYYCKTKGGGLCLIKQARLNLPVKVEQAAQNKELRVSYKLPAL